MMISEAEYIKDYQIKVYFIDGTFRVIDLCHFSLSSKNHLVNKYLNISLFKQFRVELGTLCWGNNEFDLNPVNIYNGRCDAKTSGIKNIKHGLNKFSRTQSEKLTRKFSDE